MSFGKPSFIFRVLIYLLNLFLGNTALAVVRVSQSYDCLKTSFIDIKAEVNELHEGKTLTTFGKTFEIEFLIGGDYKISFNNLHCNILVYSYICLLYTSPSPRDS